MRHLHRSGKNEVACQVTLTPIAAAAAQWGGEIKVHFPCPLPLCHQDPTATLTAGFDTNSPYALHRCTDKTWSLLRFVTCVQSLKDWPGNSHVTIAGEWLPAGKYLLQLALDPARSKFQIGEHGVLPFDVFWKLQLLPTADAKGCPIVPDDSKQKYSQVGDS